MQRTTRAIVFTLLTVFILTILASCSERACTVRANHAKWKKYNSIQYSGNKAVRKR